jgi:hypothetical protein
MTDRQAAVGRPKLPKVSPPKQFRSTYRYSYLTDNAIMSRASKLTLATTSLGAIGIVIFVHYSQRAEKAVRGNEHLLFVFALTNI